jgi:HSP20 family protein
MGSSPGKGKEQTIKIESEIDELSEPFFAIFGFESIKEEGFPVIDVFENSDNIFIEAELPGIDRERVRISVAEGQLIIEGDKAGDREESGKVNYICIERSFGKFCRTVDIPKAADTSKVRARYKEGILLVTIPKVKEQRKKKRKIEIE